MSDGNRHLASALSCWAISSAVITNEVYYCGEWARVQSGLNGTAPARLAFLCPLSEMGSHVAGLALKPTV